MSSTKYTANLCGYLLVIYKRDIIITIFRAAWTEVKVKELLDHDLENFPLYVRTNSLLGSDERMALNFYTADMSVGKDPSGTWSGGLFVDFTSPPSFYILWCGRFEFQTNLPSDREKTWKITLDRYSLTYTDVRLVVHCNDVEVINERISESLSICPRPISDFAPIWRRITKKIAFREYDTASDFYSGFNMGKRLNEIK